MANQQINRLLRRRPEIDEAEFELLQSRVLARLSKADPEVPEESEEANPDAEATEAAVAVAATGDDPDAAHLKDAEWSPAAIDTHLVPGQVTTSVAPGSEAVPDTETVTDLEPVPVAAAVAFAADPVPIEVPTADVEPVEAAAANAGLDDQHTATAEPSLDPSDLEEPLVDRPPETVTPATRVARPVSTEQAPAPIGGPVVPARAKREPRAAVPAKTSSTPKPSAVSPYCPYCALLLESAPEVSRRCPRCRERIVVKRVDGRAVYLTEAAVLVFDAERKRMANAGRWTRERARWLKVAAAVGAPADRMTRLQAAPLSDEAVAAARSLYTSTVDRSFRAARGERRWEDASRIMREHAHILSKLAGSPIPPPEDSILAHRQGAAAALRGVGEMAREAELVSARCCEICQADDGRTFRIAQELRVPRLPHAGCPKGLCRCDWYLAVRDQSTVRRQLRRRARADTSATSRSA